MSKSKLKKWSLGILSGVLFAGFNLYMPSWSQAAPPPHAPAHGYRAKKNYNYMYYPRSQVYYSPTRRLYYYPVGTSWRYGSTVPVGINLGNGISINLGGPTPYVYHPTVIEQYPVIVQ